MRHVVAAVAGLIFALGLGISGMTDPGKVIGFLDVGGAWEPALAFVMGGAVVVYALAYRLIVRRPRPVVEVKFSLPTAKKVTTSLVVGSALFGIGWGLGGYCPGPALTSVVSGSWEVGLFVVTMLAGMGLHQVWERLSARGSAAAAPAPAAPLAEGPLKGVDA